LAKISTISSDSIFDLAVRLYGRVGDGLYDIIRATGVPASIPVGTVYEYTPVPAKTTLVAPVKINRSKETTYLSRDAQNIFDVAVQLFGDVGRIDRLIPIIRTFGLAIPLYTPITYTPTKDPIAAFFSGRIVATSFLIVEDIMGNIRLLEDGEPRLLEDGTFRLLE